MHEGLQSDGIPHGNIKTSNILFNNEMHPCISEYGLAEVDLQNRWFLDQTKSCPKTAFDADTCSFGLVLLELLTGEPVLNNGYDLAKLMDSTILYDLIAQVLDRPLVSNIMNKEQMMSLALKCIGSSSKTRPRMREVAEEIKSI